MGKQCLPRCNHDDILSGLKVQKLVEDVIATRDYNCGRILQVRRDFRVEDSGLDLVWNQKEDDCGKVSTLVSTGVVEWKPKY